MELRFILLGLYRKRWIGINIFASIFLVIVVGTLIVTPQYNSTSIVQMKKSNAVATMLNSLGQSTGGSSISDTEKVTIQNLVTSRPVIERVIKAIDLKRERVRSRIMNAIPFAKTILSAIGVDVSSTHLKMTAQELTKKSMTAGIFPRPFAEVEAVDDSDLLEITGYSPDPQQAERIANSIAREFIENEKRRAASDYAKVIKIARGNLNRARDDFLSNLKASGEYQKKEKILNLDSEISTTITRVNDLRQKIEDSGMALETSRITVDEISGKLVELPEYKKSSETLVSNPMIEQLKQSLTEQYLSRVGAKLIYTENHPTIITINAKIAEIKEKIRDESAKTFASESVGSNSIYQSLSERLIETYINIAEMEGTEEGYRRLLEKHESYLVSLPDKVFESAGIDLKLSASQTIYKTLLTALKQLELTENSVSPAITIAELAVAPELDDRAHRTPDIFLNTIIAIFLGTVIGVSASLLFFHMDNSVYSVDEIRGITGVRVLGSIPKGKDGAEHSDAFRIIRRSMVAENGEWPRIVAVSSCLRGEGRSFVAANLSTLLAGRGERVVLVSADLKGGKDDSYIKSDMAYGLSDLLTGKTETENAVCRTRIEGLSYISAGMRKGNSGELFESEKMKSLLNELRESYSVVIIDAPPAVEGAGTMALGELCDATILTVKWGGVSKDRLADVSTAFTDAGITLGGVAINQSPSATLFY